MPQTHTSPPPEKSPEGCGESWPGSWPGRSPESWPERSPENWPESCPENCPENCEKNCGKNAGIDASKINILGAEGGNGPATGLQPALEIYLIHSNAETPLLANFKMQKNLHIFTGNLTQTAAFLTTCDALLTSSSGPWHLAAAVGTPTLGIISQYSYNFWRPLEGKHSFVLPENNDKDVRPIKVKTVLEMVQKFFKPTP